EVLVAARALDTAERVPQRHRRGRRSARRRRRDHRGRGGPEGRVHQLPRLPSRRGRAEPRAHGARPRAGRAGALPRPIPRAPGGRLSRRHGATTRRAGHRLAARGPRGAVRAGAAGPRRGRDAPPGARRADRRGGAREAPRPGPQCAAGASVKPRALVILPYDASALGREEQWLGEGVAQLVALGLAQHPGFVQIERARVRAYGQPEVWGETAVLQAARGVRADAAVFGRIERRGDDYVILARLLEVRGGGGGEGTALEPVAAPEGELLARVAALPLAYAKALRVPLTDAE